jgi:hypothetical protein
VTDFIGRPFASLLSLSLYRFPRRPLHRRDIFQSFCTYIYLGSLGKWSATSPAMTTGPVLFEPAALRLLLPVSFQPQYTVLREERKKIPAVGVSSLLPAILTRHGPAAAWPGNQPIRLARNAIASAVRAAECLYLCAADSVRGHRRLFIGGCESTLQSLRAAGTASSCVRAAPFRTAAQRSAKDTPPSQARWSRLVPFFLVLSGQCRVTFTWASLSD